MRYDVDALLPLTPGSYHVLLALGDEVLHGYGIILAWEEMTEGRETLLPGSLYSTLARMCEQGLIEPAAAPAADASGGPMRSYYRMTALGRAAARAESARRARLLEHAHARGLAARHGAR